MKQYKRSPEQIKEHYEVEKELAARLLSASTAERRGLYAEVYDELYRRIPHHPQLTQKRSAEDAAAAAATQMQLIAPFLSPDVTFLEIGPGDCSVSLAAAGMVKQVYAVDVSDAITADLPPTSNFLLVLSDGVSVPVAAMTAHVAYSNQLMEHLHPDDAFEQLSNIYDALAPGGAYICVTPNRMSGPHDISLFFDTEASGFHLREYTVTELSKVFRKVGFSKIQVLAGGKGKYRPLPLFWPLACEALLALLPASLRKRLAFRPPFRWLGLLNIRLLGRK